MLQLLKFAPAVQGQRQVAGFGPPRRVLRAALLRAAGLAVQLAARLDAPAREKPAAVAAVRPFALAGAAGVRCVEAVVLFALGVYFVAGLAVVVTQ